MFARRALRTIVLSATTGALAVSAAWAGGGLIPVRSGELPVQVPSAGTPAVPGATSKLGAPSGVQAQGIPAPGQFLVGASKVSIEPKPDAAKGERWEQDFDKCATMAADPSSIEAIHSHAHDFRVHWPENPDCLYAGGYGIGPMNPLVRWDDTYGLHVRSVAFSDGNDVVVMSILDGTSYFGAYEHLCAPRGDVTKTAIPTTESGACGAYVIGESLRTELGYATGKFGLLLASTHSHTAPDFIGGWGAVPDWYMAQVTDAIKTSVRNAVNGMASAVVETGEVLVRTRNGERRDFYHSAEDQTMSWLRAYTQTSAGRRVIATLGGYAAHPVTADSNGMANADFPGVFSKNLENKGGVALFFQTGLGNMSPRGSTEDMGNGLADLIPPVGGGTPVPGTGVAVTQTFWNQPVTNSGLLGLGIPGFFDRTFAKTPASVTTGKSPDRKPCVSASPISVNVAVSAARVGNVVFTGAPGETFSNLTNTIEEKTPSVAFPLAQVNDGLGYIVQSFETDHLGRQAVGFVGEVAEYEDAYSIDHCFGDMVLETTLGLVGTVLNTP